jgi:uncharacterized protein
MVNRLIHETSPYLRQHAHNPVDWYAWGAEAFERARAEDKPIHLSVGYAACHWCHVMAHESFEDPELAALLNQSFISIKVDRQERPDVDEVYQKVVQMMGQGGGWPLTVFMTAEGEPFFGGTYFPARDGFGRPSFGRVLLGLKAAWLNHRDELLQSVARFREGYRVIDAELLGVVAPSGADVAAEAARFLAENTDLNHGGLGGAPKFPNPSCYDLMLRIYHRCREPVLLECLEVTLDCMSEGGIYDHIGGGFSRYSVDGRWSVPHFEKMLYDNAQLVKLYADAYRLTGKVTWRRVFEDTIDYVFCDLTHPSGGFFSSEDADSEGEEGKFYVWTRAEFESVLGSEDAEFACKAYGVTRAGNFEHGTTVLHRNQHLDTAELARLRTVREQLRAARAHRLRPSRDENILTSWNALMIQGLCAAYQATGTESYLVAAQKTADFVERNLTSVDGALLHVWKDGKARVPGFLDDYAFLANALLDLYESCFERHYLDRAVALVEAILARFWDNGLYFTAKDGESLICRPQAPHDHAWPSGISTSVFALLRLYELTLCDLYLERARSIQSMFMGAAANNPFGFAHLLASVEFSQRGAPAIVLAGDRTRLGELVHVVHRFYLPARTVAVAEDVAIGSGRSSIDGMPTAYACWQRTCSAPTTDPAVLKTQLATAVEGRVELTYRDALNVP